MRHTHTSVQRVQCVEREGESEREPLTSTNTTLQGEVQRLEAETTSMRDELAFNAAELACKEQDYVKLREDLLASEESRRRLHNKVCMDGVGDRVCGWWGGWCVIG